MYKIEQKNYGYKLTFEGRIDNDEMSQWVEDSKSKLTSAPSKFSVMVDMRNLKPLLQEAQETMASGQKLYKQAGMERSAVVVNSAVLKMQFNRLAKESGIYQWERYIDASATADWESVATKWLTDAIDPDKAPVGSAS